MAARFAWLTPDEPIAPSVERWALSIPSQFVQDVRGALAPLCDVWNWEQSGDMTPQECADALFDVYLSFGRLDLIGTVHEYFTSELPDGVLLCDGGVYNRVDYPALYAVLNSAYIIDADTFATPDLLGRVVMGGNAGDVGDEVGEETHTLTVDEMPSHSHTMPYQSTFPYGNIPEVTVTGGLLTTNTGDAGGGQAHNNMQPTTTALMGIIAR